MNVTYSNLFFPAVAVSKSRSKSLEEGRKGEEGPKGKLEMEVDAVKSPAPEELSGAEVER
jgi:hypothetical protein